MPSPKDPRFPCAFCGEPVVPGREVCPHCGEIQPAPEGDAPIPYWTTLDLHDDLPSWDEAEHRLHRGLADLVMGRSRSLLVIHGYGSRGGAGQGEIKRRLHARLRDWADDSLSKAWFAGETLTGFEAWQQLPPALQRQNRLQEQLQGNYGATLVLA